MRFSILRLQKIRVAMSAIVKTLYFALPDLIIKKVMEESFLENFEKEILPRYVVLYHDNGECFDSGIRK